MIIRIYYRYWVQFANSLFDELVNETLQTLENLTINTQYFWRVQTINEAHPSEWSDVWSFTTEDPADVAESNKFSFSIAPQPMRDEAVVTFEANTANGRY